MGVGYEVMGLMKTLLMGPILPAMLCRLSCCIRLHTTYNTDATTPNVAGPRMLEVVASVCTYLHKSHTRPSLCFKAFLPGMNFWYLKQMFVQNSIYFAGYQIVSTQYSQNDFLLQFLQEH